MNQTFSRRTVLRGLGTAVALPWLEAIAPAAAPTSIGTDTPVRMAFLYVPNGMHMPDWIPGESESQNFSLPKILEPVKRHRQQMNLFTGLTLDGAYSHGDGGGITPAAWLLSSPVRIREKQTVKIFPTGYPWIRLRPTRLGI